MVERLLNGSRTDNESTVTLYKSTCVKDHENNDDTSNASTIDTLKCELTERACCGSPLKFYLSYYSTYA